MKIFFTTLIILLLSQGLIYPQKILHSEGTSEVRLESSMTKDQAKDKAEELAIINAIENAFGSFVEQQSDVRIQDGRVNYDILGGIRVRGEWIKTKGLKLDEETRTVEGKYGKVQEVWVICNISGDVRECVSRANIDFSTLSCPVVNCRQASFINEESVFVYFKSPIDGYLSIFLDEGENTYRLLPYHSMGTLSAVKVVGDKEYIFFSKERDHQFDSQYPTDALELTTDKEVEYNNVYVVFAEKPYIKPILSDIKEMDDGYLLPKSVNSGDFQEWLSDCRATMTDFQSVRIRISIEKK